MEQDVDQLLYEYLSGVTAASQHLPSIRRIAYIQEVRERIERKRAERQVTTATQMQRVLDEFGEPDELVERDHSSAGAPSEPTPASPLAPRHGRRPLGLLSRPVSFRRAPPPWRGGPRRTTLHRRSADGSKRRQPGAFMPQEGVIGRISPGVVFVRVAHGIRKSPTSAVAALAYLLAAVIAPLTVLWPLAAAQVAFGALWQRVDRWIAVGGPLATTAIGMALWPGDAPYIDVMITESFLATGIWGLRVGAFLCAFYLFIRFARIIATIRVEAGHFPATGDTPFGSASGKSQDKSD